jgi:hypothetical protein
MKNAQKGRENDAPKVMGRPRIIQSPEDMDRLVDLYVENCRNAEKPQPITLTGMILALGLSSRQSLDEYAKLPHFFDSVKRAKLIIECEYENRLITSTSATGSIFALKNLGWVDKHTTYLEELQARKLERELQLDDEQAQPVQVSVGVEDAS